MCPNVYFSLNRSDPRRIDLHCTYISDIAYKLEVTLPRTFESLGAQPSYPSGLSPNFDLIEPHASRTESGSPLHPGKRMIPSFDWATIVPRPASPHHGRPVP